METETEYMILYKKLMYEVKARLHAIHSILKKRTTTSCNKTNYEFCCLQIRKVLELIVYGSLLANADDLKAVAKNMDKWHRVKSIREELLKINNNFWPNPQRQEGMDLVDLPPNTDYLKETDFDDVFDFVSKYVHCTNPLSSDFQTIEKTNLDYSRIIKIYSDIISLTNCHVVQPKDMNVMYRVLMRAHHNKINSDGTIGDIQITELVRLDKVSP